MKTIYIFLIIKFLSLQVFAQNTMQKSFFSIQAGACYKTFLGSKYIEPTQYNYGDEFTEHQYERFKKTPTFGFNAGILFTYRFNNQCGITSGLLYFLRKDIFENNQDTVIKYGNGSSMRDIHNVLKYNYSYNNLELPLLFQYSVKKITLYIGCYFALITYKKATYTYVVNRYPSNPQWITSDKTISGFEKLFKLFPTFQVSYEIAIENIKLNPYLAFCYDIKNKKDFYTQIGINMPLVIRHKTITQASK